MINNNDFHTIREALKWASSLLQKEQHHSKIADWLMQSLINIDHTQLMLRLDEPLDQQKAVYYKMWVMRVINGEPYQYITGVEQFYGREFTVSAAVLIPRPETELLVEGVLQRAERLFSNEKNRLLKVVDIGTGSGAIAITLAAEWASTGQAFDIVGLDISDDALQVAKHNSEKLNTSSVRFMKSDMLDELVQANEKVDIIVSNPPYIPYSEQEDVQAHVLNYEPHTALFATEEGLYFYRNIVSQASYVLKERGLIAFEVGIHQAQQVVDIITNAYPQAHCEIVKDFQGIERMVFATISLP